MTRYRAVTFDHRFGPWCPTSLLAMQAAVEAGDASRDPRTGIVHLNAGVWIEGAAGEADMSIEEVRWGDALQVLHDHREKALGYAREQLKMAGEDAPLRWRWRDIGRRIGLVLEAAEKDGRPEGASPTVRLS